MTQLQTKTGVKQFEGVQHDIVVMEDDLREEGMEDIKKKARRATVSLILSEGGTVS